MSSRHLKYCSHIRSDVNKDYCVDDCESCLRYQDIQKQNRKTRDRLDKRFSRKPSKNRKPGANDRPLLSQANEILKRYLKDKKYRELIYILLHFDGVEIEGSPSSTMLRDYSRHEIDSAVSDIYVLIQMRKIFERVLKDAIKKRNRTYLLTVKRIYGNQAPIEIGLELYEKLTRVASKTVINKRIKKFLGWLDGADFNYKTFYDREKPVGICFLACQYDRMWLPTERNRAINRIKVLIKSHSIRPEDLFDSLKPPTINDGLTALMHYSLGLRKC